MSNPKSTFLVLDANAILHRAFYALPPLTTKEGKPINAVYGFLLVLFKVIRELKPDFLAVAFDFPAPTFREKLFKEYKAKRPKAPDEFYQQIPEIKKILQRFGIKIFEKEGYEADDIIGTIAKLIREQKKDSQIETIIVTGDTDMLQLVDPITKVYLLKRGIKNITLYDEDLVKENLGLLPNQIPDFKALFGDPSDNIPGVCGIGKKTAYNLIKNFQNLENLYNTLEDRNDKYIKAEIRPKIKEALLRYKKQAFLSRELAQINKNVPIKFELSDCGLENLQEEKTKKVLESYGFKSLIKRLPEIFKKQPQEKKVPLQKKLI